MINMGKPMNPISKKLKSPVDVAAAAILLIIAVFLLCFLFRYARTFLLGLAYVEKYDHSTVHQYEMIVLREEYLVHALEPGEFSAIAEEGQRVKENDLIGNTPALQVKAPHSGLVYYDTDGWEDILAPDAVDDTDWVKVLALLTEDKAQVDPSSEEMELVAGRSIARVVDNLTDVSVFLKAPWISDEIEIGSSIRFYTDEICETAYTARVTEYGTLKDGSCYVVARVPEADEWFYSVRYAPVYVTGEQLTGMSVPVNAVVFDEETQLPAVYRAEGLVMSYTPISILCQLDDVLLVDGLDETDLIATRPWFAADGQRIYAMKK